MTDYATYVVHVPLEGYSESELERKCEQLEEALHEFLERQRERLEMKIELDS